MTKNGNLLKGVIPVLLMEGGVACSIIASLPHDVVADQ